MYYSVIVFIPSGIIKIAKFNSDGMIDGKWCVYSFGLLRTMAYLHKHNARYVYYVSEDNAICYHLYK